jgi:tetratricopeptide (TPR) repeat protein
MKSGTLKKAQALFQKKRYAEVIRLLESQVFLFRENPRFYYMLGVSCLHTEDVGGAQSYLKRAQQLETDDTQIMLALAAVQLMRRDTEESLRLWLEILEREPKNRIARKGLELIKRNMEPGMLLEAVEAGKIRALYPKPPFRVPRWIFGVAVALLVLAPAVFLLRPVITTALKPPPPERAGAEVLKIGPDVKNITAYNGTFRYILTPTEIKDTFLLIQKYFDGYRDNMAAMETNRILESNASPALKEKAKLFRDYLRKPDFVTFRDNFTYQQVMAAPSLYNDCYVRWKGKVSNLQVTDAVITFDFLVGYQTEKVLDGIVPVTMHFAANIQNAEALEIIAKISTNGRKISLTATSIRPILAGGS